MNNPKKILSKLCEKIKIPYDENMLNWPKGKRGTDGIWSKIWYENVINSTGFKRKIKSTSIKMNVPIKYKQMHKECLKIYQYMNNYKI